MGIIRNDQGNRRPGGLSLLLGVFCLYGAWVPVLVQAGPWELNPRITVQEVFSDNIELATSGSEESDFVTELTPGFNLEARDIRYLLDVDYAFQGLIYTDDSGRNDTNHLLAVDGLTELVHDHGFVEVDVGYAPRNVSSADTIGLDNINPTDKTNVLTYAITPYWIQPFRNYAIADVRYTYDEVLSGSDSLADTSAHTVRGNLHNGNHFTQWLWSLDYFEQYVETADVDETTRFRRGTGRVDYLVTPHWGVIGRLGFDDNDFGTTGDDPNGLIWGLGLRWAPNSRTYMEVTGGERFFGRTFTARVERTGRRLVWRASYTEEPDVTRSTFLSTTVFPSLDAFGQPIISPITGQPETLSLTVPTQVADVFISKSLVTSVNYTGRAHDFELGIGTVEREFQTSGTQDDILDTNLAWTWRFTPRARSRVSFRYIDQEFRGGGESQFYVYDFALIKRFGRGLEGSVGARRVDRQSDGSIGEYDENRAFVLLVKTF